MEVSFQNSEETHCQLSIPNANYDKLLIQPFSCFLDYFCDQEENITRENTKKQNGQFRESAQAKILVEEKLVKFQNSKVEKDDSEKLVKCQNLKVQKDHSKELVKCQNLKVQKDHSKELVKRQNLKVQKDHSKELVKCQNLKVQKNHSVNSVTSNMSVQVHKDSEFSKEFYQTMTINKPETYVLKMENYNRKLEYFDDNIWPCNPLDDQSIPELFFSVLLFICEKEGNTIFKKTDSYFSKSEPEIENNYSDSYCIECIRIMLHFLNEIKKDLQIKEKEATQLKLYFEANFKDLILFSNLGNIKEHVENEFYNLPNAVISLIDRSDQLLNNIKKEITECDWYCENLENMLNFLSQNCSFITH